MLHTLFKIFILRFTESVIGMSKKEKLVQCLQELQKPNYSTPDDARRTNAAADRALNLIFEIGRQKTGFTSEEKTIIGALLTDAIRPILGHIERVGCIYRTRLDSATLRKRSALQFLIDDYGAFPAIVQTVNKVLEQENVKESIGILDNIIRKWRDESDSEVQSDRDSSGIPNSHNWWSS